LHRTQDQDASGAGCETSRSSSALRAEWAVVYTTSHEQFHAAQLFTALPRATALIWLDLPWENRRAGLVERRLRRPAASRTRHLRTLDAPDQVKAFEQASEALRVALRKAAERDGD
jgi:hypothetical protein